MISFRPQELSKKYRIFIERLNKTHGKKSEIENLFNSYIQNFIKLNKKLKFSCFFKEDYVWEQIESLFRAKTKALTFIPFGIKDIFNTKVLPTEMGSEIWKGFLAGNNARIVDEIIHSGGLVFCKTTTAEFAVHYIDHEKTLNPFNPNHITGTSSSGSAVSVACGALPVSLATQTAGSIIRPGSFCGVFGFKPSFGAFDRTGVLKTNDTLDTIGLLGCNIEILINSFLSLYQNSKDYPLSKKYIESYSKNIARKPNILLLSKQFKNYLNYEDYIQNSFEDFSKKISREYNLVTVSKRDMEFINKIHDSHQIIYDKSLSYYFEEEAKVHNKISSVMSSIIRRGANYSKKEYISELKQQINLTSLFYKLMDKYEIDYILTPSTASCAPLIGDREIDDTALIWTYLGIPSLSLPIFFNRKLGLPYGLQLVGLRYSDISLLKFGSKLYDLFKEY